MKRKKLISYLLFIIAPLVPSSGNNLHILFIIICLLHSPTRNIARKVLRLYLLIRLEEGSLRETARKAVVAVKSAGVPNRPMTG